MEIAEIQVALIAAALWLQVFLLDSGEDLIVLEEYFHSSAVATASRYSCILVEFWRANITCNVGISSFKEGCIVLMVERRD